MTRDANDAPVTVEQGQPCPNCLEPVQVGQVVLPWDDAGEMHADCARPYRTDHAQQPECPAPCVLIGDPMRLIPLAALASSPAGDGVEEAESAYREGFMDGAESQRSGYGFSQTPSHHAQADEDAAWEKSDARKAALARPRAAVGEREIAMIKAAFIEGLHTGPDGGQHEWQDDAWIGSDAFAALQSPPAKVDEPDVVPCPDVPLEVRQVLAVFTPREGEGYDDWVRRWFK